MLVLVKALRPTVAGGAHHDPGSEFYLEELDAVYLEGKGVVERVHEKGPPDNKMSGPPENKAFSTTESPPRKEPKEIRLEKPRKAAPKKRKLAAKRK